MSIQRTILINASNLHVGGGVQVATSVIKELTLFKSLPAGLTIWASSEVDANLRNIHCELDRIPNYEVTDSYGLNFLFSSSARKLTKFDASFTVFGPLYTWHYSGVNIVGFAQPWVIYPDNEISSRSNWSKKIFTKFKYAMQAYFFRRADMLIVELDHVRDRLLKLGIGKQNNIKVVHNCLSSVYISRDNWTSLQIPETKADIRLGFVGRNYEHKNSRIFPEIKAALKSKHGITVSIYVTFNDEEWTNASQEFRDSVTNVGVLYVAECPSFYKQMDAIVFPSLLECFSSTPLEAMAMKRPLFASDRPFNRDVCGDHARYFDPVSPLSAADAIAAWFRFKSSHPIEAEKQLQLAHDHAIGFSSPEVRARKYLDFLSSSV